MRAPPQPSLTEDKIKMGQKAFGAWDNRNSWEMTHTKQLLLWMHHFRSLQLKEAVLSTEAQITLSLGAWLSEHRGSTAAFPLVTRWENTLLGIS